MNNCSNQKTPADKNTKPANPKPSKTTTTTTKPTKRQIGYYYETCAKDFLCQQGLIFLDRNFKIGNGDIDLIFFDPKTEQTIFVEVRYRRNRKLFAKETINFEKQQKLIRYAKFYFRNSFTQAKKKSGRFDVIAISPNQNHHPKIEWIKNAFSTS